MCVQCLYCLWVLIHLEKHSFESMKKKLFEEVFKKAENQSGKSSKHGLSAHLESHFSDELNFPTSKMTFVRYYEKYIEGKIDSGNNPNTPLLDKTSEYLGYKNYEDFVSKNGSTNADLTSGNDKTIPAIHGKQSNISNHFKKHRVTLIVSLALIALFIILQSITRQRWMIWQENQYIEVNFDPETYEIGKLKLYNEERIENFKRVIPECNTKFFNESGQANLWYGKNENNQYEYFTSLGKHPETGKTLKEITPYMITTHICKTN